METKMRITLYNDNQPLPISDRLVEQGIELNMGPKIAHKGPLVISFSLHTQDDANAASEYLKKLVGILPLKTKAVKLRKGIGSVELDNNEPLEDFANQAIKTQKSQEKLINFLRDHNFKCIMTDVITEVVPELNTYIKLKPKHQKYQWFIRQIKAAKDPTKDKYDPRLMFGIKLIGNKVDKVVVYLFGKFYVLAKIGWEKQKTYNFKKVDTLTKFPDHMDYDDRKKWRAEYRKVITNPNHKPSKFYEKHKPWIKFFERGKEVPMQQSAKELAEKAGTEPK